MGSSPKTFQHNLICPHNLINLTLKKIANLPDENEIRICLTCKNILKKKMADLRVYILQIDWFWLSSRLSRESLLTYGNLNCHSIHDINLWRNSSIEQNVATCWMFWLTRHKKMAAISAMSGPSSCLVW